MITNDLFLLDSDAILLFLFCLQLKKTQRVSLVNIYAVLTPCARMDRNAVDALAFN